MSSNGLRCMPGLSVSLVRGSTDLLVPDFSARLKPAPVLKAKTLRHTQLALRSDPECVHPLSLDAACLDRKVVLLDPGEPAPGAGWNLLALVDPRDGL